MKYIFYTFLLLLVSHSMYADNNPITVSGVLLDETDQQPIIAGSIELLNAKDSVVLTGAISRLDGTFSIPELTKGNYILRVTYIGYEPITQNLSLSESKPQVNVGTLLMKTNDILLNEALVEGKRPEIVVKNDTIEYDAGSYKVTENAAVEELLKKLPGVEVDNDGKISVNGKEVKKFLVDGKEFFTDDPQVASKNLPAEMVEKLQVMDRRSEMAQMTGFDDGEEETVINITVKEGMKQGTMGNALFGAGKDIINDKDWRYQGAAFINHMRNSDRYTLILGTNNNNNMGAADLGANQFGGMRMRRGGGGGIATTTNFMFSMNKELSKATTLNGDIRYNGSDRLSLSKVEKTTLSSVESQLDKSNTRTDYQSNNLSANFRLEWKPDTVNTLIFRPNIRYNNSKSNETEELNRYNYDTQDPLFFSNSLSDNEGKGLSLGGTLDYSFRFSKPGRVLSLNVQGDYNDNSSWENAYTYKKSFVIDDPEKLFDESWLNQRMENQTNSNNIRGTVSWVEPLGKNFFLQGLYRIAYYDTKSLNSTYDLYLDNIVLDSPWWQDELSKYALIDPSKSRSTLRNSLEQRFALNVKAVREKYNITLGLNIDPTSSTNTTYQPSEGSVPPQEIAFPYGATLLNQRGDSLISEIPLDVVNFSPIINFNYIFGQRSNLRIDYEGSTNQPSATQLRDYIDTSRPTEWTQGNPNLKPGYTNRIRARFNKYVQASQLMYNFHLDGNYSVNDITSVTQFLEDGIRLTTYENVSGNWNINLRGMFNMPLRNKKFTVGSFAMASMRNQNSYVSEKGVQNIAVENNSKNFALRNRSHINYRSDLFDVGLNINFNYNDIAYTALPDNNQRTYNYGVGGYTTWYLPANFTIESDINYTRRKGYASGYNNPETIWNAAISKQLFNKKYGVGSLKLQIYDILQNRNNVVASTTTNGYQTSEVNVIPSYFMCSFIYKFTAFPKSSSATMEDLRGGERRWGPPGGGPPPGGHRF